MGSIASLISQFRQPALSSRAGLTGFAAWAAPQPHGRRHRRNTGATASSSGVPLPTSPPTTSSPCWSPRCRIKTPPQTPIPMSTSTSWSRSTAWSSSSPSTRTFLGSGASPTGSTTPPVPPSCRQQVSSALSALTPQAIRAGSFGRDRGSGLHPPSTLRPVLDGQVCRGNLTAPAADPRPSA